MQTFWTVNGSDTLLLFFSGWAMDERATQHLISDECDICACFNYQDFLTDDIEKWQQYKRVKLVAWSMGVWAAEQVLPSLSLNIVSAVAVNGTSTPVDDRFGIPTYIAKGTCDNLTPQSFMKFLKRVSAGFKYVPVEGLEGRKDELSKIIAAEKHEPKINWGKAIISKQDAIFPSENLIRFWTDRCPIEQITAPHYPFHLYKTWKEIAGE